MRIASLLASATEMVAALGLEDRLVAISHECDFPPGVLSRPRVSRPRFDPEALNDGEIDTAVRHAMVQHGSPYAVDLERLKTVAPDIILTQAVCEVCAVPTSMAEDAARALGDSVRVLSLDAHSIEDVLASLTRLGAVLGAPERAARVVEALGARIAAVAAAVAGGPRPSVLAVEWLNPPFVPGHWVPEMIQVAGGRNLAGDAGRPSREAAWEPLSRLDPDVLIVMPCGYGLARSRHAADQHADALRAVAPRAVAAGRAWVVDGSAYFNRSGPRIADGVEMLGVMLHPNRVVGVDLRGRAERWP
ncbi:MAG TPA: ABC transporter substrate-binding protein [Gemmatimonadales bacterium]|nr:ABC transporter substrate-binding protein [Gemmatimonadales bacterium]